MRTLYIYIFLLISTCKINAQINELGVFLGGINYIGDVGPTDYISPNKPAFGIMYKWNRSKRHAYRFSYSQGNITANDFDSKSPNRKLRGNTFKNSIKELSAGLEFNFFDFDLHDHKKTTTPYIFSGINLFVYDEIFILGNESRKDYSYTSLSIPMILGVKTRLVNNFILGLEVGARYTFTDNLDGSNPKNENFETLKFGNQNSKDWYVFSGITLTYTFGKNPCFCAN